MKFMNKTLFLAIGLCLVGQSLCSDSTKTGSLTAFKFPSWTLRLSQTQKDEAKKWALPIALGVSGAVGIWAAWALMKHSAKKQNKAPLIPAQQPKSMLPQATLTASILSQESSTYCQKLDCWQTNKCPIHTRSDNHNDVSFAELEELVQERNALERQKKEILTNSRLKCHLPCYGYAGQQYFEILNILTTAPDCQTRFNDRIALGIKQNQ